MQSADYETTTKWNITVPAMVKNYNCMMLKTEQSITLKVNKVRVQETTGPRNTVKEPIHHLYSLLTHINIKEQEKNKLS